MSRLSRQESRVLAELTEELRTVRVGGPAGLDTALPVVRSLLQCDAAVAYGFSTRKLEPELDFVYSSGFGASTPRFDELMVTATEAFGPGWGLYDPIRPLAAQRNKLLHLPPLASLPLGERRAAWAKAFRHMQVPPIAAQRRLIELRDLMLRRLGLDRRHQLRVLLCEHEGLLAWFGVFLDAAPGDRERTVLRKLIAPLRKRASIDERLRDAGFDAAIGRAALDALCCAAFVIDGHGRVATLNAAGRTLLSRDPQAVHHILRAAARGREAPGVTAIAVHVAGLPRYLLVQFQAGEAAVRGRAQRAQAAWKLTPREVQVLCEVANGASNKQIAASLACSVATVEVHMSRLLRKSHAESRAQLVAAFWRADATRSR